MRTAFLLLFITIAFTGCGRSTHWEVELHNQDTALAFKFIEQGGSRMQTVIFDDVHPGVLKPRYYRLPEDVADIQAATLEFSDITLRPGRVRFTYRAHTFDIMQRVLIIDGQEHPWNAPTDIHLKSPNHALQRTAPGVTLAAADLPATCAHPAPRRLRPQPARRPPQSLSLGSFGASSVP